MNKKIPLKTYIENKNLRDCYRIIYQISKIKAFLDNEYTLVKSSKDANIVIITSCITFSSNIKKNYKLIDKHIKNNKKIIFYGCISNKIQKDINKKYGNNIIIIKSDDENKFNNIYKNVKINFSESINLKAKENNYYLKSPFLVIGKGCINNCSYCIIREGKKIESYPIDKIMKTFVKKYNLGIREFVLASDNLGTYGVENNLDVFKLIKKILAYNKSVKINLHHIYPKFLIDQKEKIIELLKTGQINTIFIPIQHRNSRILKLMNRCDYNHKELESILKEIKKNFPKIEIRTHLMYGFPTETHNEFIDNLKNIALFDHVYFFEFCPNYKINKKIIALHSLNTLQKRKDIIKKLLKKLDYVSFRVKNDYIHAYRGSIENLFTY